MTVTLLALVIMIIATSCSSSQRAVNRFENFSYELRDNGRYYSLNDWKEAADSYLEIRKDLGKRKLTSEQRHQVGVIEGKCVRYVYEGLKGHVRDFGSEVNGVLEGLMDMLDL